jgi:type I restriction enzyme S subunit
MDVYKVDQISKAHLSMNVTATPAQVRNCSILAGDLFFTPSSETVDDIGHAAVAIEDIPDGVYSYHLHRLRFINLNEINPNFIRHMFRTSFMQKQIRKNASGMTRFGLTKGKWEALVVPLPPLVVQNKIVSILDRFNQLESELEAELEARKRQFNYFVDELTSAGTASRFGGLTRPLGDLGEFVRGTGLQKSDLSEEGAPALHYGQIFTYYKTKIHSAKSMVSPQLAASIRHAQRGDVIVATTSENIADVCKSVVWLGEGDLAVGGETYIFKHELDPLYATYLFRSSDFQYQKLSYISGTKVKRVSGKALEKMTVSVPNREAQFRIGSFLSQLEDLLGDVNEGLPAEIEARRKQYEYYRNTLLTFKELDAA